MKYIVFIAIVSILFACKKDKTCNQDMAGIAGTYKIASIGYKANASAAEQDYYNVVFTDPCEKDDQVVFNADGTMNFKDAGVKCSPTGDYNSTWSVSGSTMTIDGDAANIQSFNCSTLVITGSGFIIAGDQIRVTYTRL